MRGASTRQPASGLRLQKSTLLPITQRRDRHRSLLDHLRSNQDEPAAAVTHNIAILRGLGRRTNKLLISKDRATQVRRKDDLRQLKCVIAG